MDWIYLIGYIIIGLIFSYIIDFDDAGDICMATLGWPVILGLLILGNIFVPVAWLFRKLKGR